MMRLNLSWRPIATGCFGLVLVVFLLNGIAVYQNTTGVHGAQNTVNHTYDVLMRAQTLTSLLKEAETQAWSYVITDESTFRENYTSIEGRIRENERILMELISDNYDQKSRVVELRKLVDLQLSDLHSLIALPAEQRLEKTRDQLLATKENAATDPVDSLIGEMTAEETKLLKSRSKAMDYGLFMVQAANLAAVVVGVAIIALAWYFVERELRMRRHAEELAHSEHQNLLVTLISIDEGVIVADSDGRVKLANPNALLLMGGPPAFVGRRLADIFPIVDDVSRQPILNPVDQVLSTRKVTSGVKRALLIRRDGAEVPIEHSAAPIQDSSGKITGAVFVFRDCSVQRQFETEMKERARHFRRVFETPLIGIAVGTSQGDLLEANNAFLSLIGFPGGKPGEMPRSWDGIPQSQLPLDEATQRELREKEICQPFEKTYTRHDGTRVPVLISAARLPDDKDRVVVFVTDLTQIKRTETALLESEARFRALSECMPQKVWTARPDGHIDYLNGMLLDYCGIPAEELMEWGWSSLIHPEDAQLQADAWKQSLTGSTMFEIELRFRHHAGEYRWHLARALPVYRPDGQIAMWVGTYTDIHNQKRAEEALRDEHRRKDEFLALLAHELRNPIAPLSNAIQVFKVMQNDPQQTSELLNIMQRQVRQMTRLIDDLLDLARITTGRMRLQCERIAIGTVVAAAVEAVQPLISGRQHHLTLSVPPEDLWIHADFARLAQVLTNLLHNAAKFTAQNGQLGMLVETAGNDVVVRVNDNGPGISENMLNRIFDLFTQAELTLDRTHGGLGIGLTLVRTLVELHGGSVTAISAGPGHGSEFIVRLPLMTPPSETVTENVSAAPPPQAQLPKLNVLVVDDVQASAKTLSMMLVSLGQNVEMAFDGSSAIELATSRGFDLIFLDIAMPSMDGLEVARQLRANPHLQAVTLVALTGFGQEEDRANSLKAGFNQHLTKPASMDLLREILASSADKSQSTDRPDDPESR